MEHSHHGNPADPTVPVTPEHEDDPRNKLSVAVLEEISALALETIQHIESNNLMRAMTNLSALKFHLDGLGNAVSNLLITKFKPGCGHDHTQDADGLQAIAIPPELAQRLMQAQTQGQQVAESTPGQYL